MKNSVDILKQLLLCVIAAAITMYLVRVPAGLLLDNAYFRPALLNILIFVPMAAGAALADSRSKRKWPVVSLVLGTVTLLLLVAQGVIGTSLTSENLRTVLVASLHSSLTVYLSFFILVGLRNVIQMANFDAPGYEG